MNTNTAESVSETEFQDIEARPHKTEIDPSGKITNRSNGSDIRNKDNSIIPVSSPSSKSIKLLKFMPYAQIIYENIYHYFFTTEKGSFTTTVRDPIVFCGPHHFSRPVSMKDVWNRVAVNSKYYLANYLILAALFALFMVITSPLALVGVALVLLFWIYTMKEESLSIGGKIIISGKYKTLLVVGVVIVMIILLGILDAIVYGGFVAAIAGSIHMVFHKPMIRSHNDFPTDDMENDEELGVTDHSFGGWNGSTGV